MSAGFADSVKELAKWQEEHDADDRDVEVDDWIASWRKKPDVWDAEPNPKPKPEPEDSNASDPKKSEDQKHGGHWLSHLQKPLCNCECNCGAQNQHPEPLHHHPHGPAPFLQPGFPGEGPSFPFNEPFNGPPPPFNGPQPPFGALPPNAVPAPFGGPNFPWNGPQSSPATPPGRFFAQIGAF